MHVSNVYAALLNIVLLLPICSAYKLVLLVADVSDSQILFNYRVASVLAEAGHKVTVVIIASYDDRDLSMMKVPKNVNTYFVNATVGKTKDEVDKEWAELTYESIPAGDPRSKKLVVAFRNVLTETCKRTVGNKEFFEWLEAEKFDLAFANTYQMCSLGVIYKAKIPTWIWLDSGLLKEFVANAVGVPQFPSFTPPIRSNIHDELTFTERIKSVSDLYTVHKAWDKSIVDVENKHFRDQFGAKFPDLRDIARQCPLVLVNDNDLYTLPLPSLAKVVNIGGIGTDLTTVNPLSEPFSTLSGNGDGVVLMSFGSVARLHMAPGNWKKAFLGAFRRLSKYQFIVRYEGDDLDGKIPENVHLTKWMPQPDLLRHSNTKAFITHGGYNSLQETIAAGVPTVMIGLFGDQQKNCQVAKKHGFAEVLNKNNMTEDAVFDALDKVLHSPKYSLKVKRLSQMVHKQPISPETLLVRWTEFVAEFKEIENMEPASQKLNFFQVYCLDIVGAFLLAVTVVLIIVFYVSFKFYKFCILRSAKHKSD